VRSRRGVGCGNPLFWVAGGPKPTFFDEYSSFSALAPYMLCDQNLMALTENDEHTTDYDELCTNVFRTTVSSKTARNDWKTMSALRSSHDGATADLVQLLNLLEHDEVTHMHPNIIPDKLHQHDAHHFRKGLYVASHLLKLADHLHPYPMHPLVASTALEMMTTAFWTPS